MKKTKGFTLVELVVIIAIIGVLAAILVPTMLNYIRKAKLKSANTNAKTAYHAVVEFVTEKNATDGTDIPTLLSLYGNKPIDCNVPPQSNMGVPQKRVHDILATNGINSGHVIVGMETINSIDTIFVQWTSDMAAVNAKLPDAVIGQFPDAVTWDTYKSPNNHWGTYIEPV